MFREEKCIKTVLALVQEYVTFIRSKKDKL